MSAQRDDVVGAIRGVQHEVERLVSSVPESAWSNQVYDQGWSAKQLLCHLTSDSGIASFLFAMAKLAGSGGTGLDLDVDAFNAQYVAARQDRSLAEILEEVRGNCQRGIDGVQNAPDDLLAQHLQAPWGAEGALADVIVGSVEEHFMMHVRDLKKAVS